MGMVEREQIISYLLQQCDDKDKVIAGLQSENAKLKESQVSLPPASTTNSSKK